jgi:hypothetical protein
MAKAAARVMPVTIEHHDVYLLSDGGPALNFKNCFAQECGGEKHSLSLRTNAQTFGSLFFEQKSGWVWRHPTVCVSLSSG